MINEVIVTIAYWIIASIMMYSILKCLIKNWKNKDNNQIIKRMIIILLKGTITYAIITILMKLV